MAVTKQHILDEIKRTAKANGGNAVGRLRFTTETGIKESDWRGVYWARWNDAIREAGLTPNEKTIAYNEDWLLGKVADFARELGHFPTLPEIRLKTRTDKEFPTDTTVATRFGNKSERILKIAEYCRNNKGYEDVLAICVTVEKSAMLPSVEDAQMQVLGFVYLIKSGRYYKIGRSNSSGRREYELAIQMPDKAVLIHQIRTDDPVGIEDYWHRRFAASRKNGEWFDLSAADVNKFKRRKFM